MKSPNTQPVGADFGPLASPHGAIELSAPRLDDGAAVTALIASCPPLDPNSAYCNLLQCSHFAETGVIARMDAEVVGWVSAYLQPQAPDTVFVWQVAVAAEARGLGLGRRMLEELLDRPACSGVRFLKTSITPDNTASWKLFASLAARLGAQLEAAPWLAEGEHLPKGHAREDLVTIGPFALRAA